MKIEIYKSSADGLWRWRAVARNGRIMADSGEGYASQRNAQRAVDTFLRAVSRPFVKTVIFAYDKRKKRWRTASANLANLKAGFKSARMARKARKRQ